MRRLKKSQIFVLLTLGAVSCAQPPAPDPTEYKKGDNSDGELASSPPPAQKPANPVPSTGTGDATSPATVDFAKAEQDCVASGFYYDLLTFECTQRPLVKVTCTVENITSPKSDFTTLNNSTTDFLAENQKTQIKTLFETQLADFKLRYCVDDGAQYTLVAVKTENDQYVLQDLDVPK